MFEASDEIYILLGRISMGMEHIHHRLASLASNICARQGRFAQVEQSLIATVSLRQLADLCEMLYLSLSESEVGRQEFKSLIKRVRELEQKRNGIVHSVWLPLGEEGEFKKWKFSKDKNKGIKFANEKFDFDEFNSVAEQCSKLNKDLISFVFKDFDQGGSPFYVHKLT